MENKNYLNTKAQVTIFIIIAIGIVVAVTGFFLFRVMLFGDNVPAPIQPAYDNFLTCLEQDLEAGISILESQGGYIYLPDLESGNEYMPFSSQLNFLGNQVPYWYYISGNGIQKTQVPSQDKMEEQLADFIESKIMDCDFEQYYDQGFEIIQGESSARTQITGNKVEANLEMVLSFSKGEDNARITSHKVIINSQLGKLYESAKDIYNYEQRELFLETYGVDVLRLYAPVDGVEITCSPEVWDADEIFDGLELAIESNTLALKTKTGRYNLNDKEDEYFVVDVSVPDAEDVRFLNSKDWPHSFEVEPSEDSTLLAMPVGNQPGVSSIGFCYVPYHFVYNLKYPVLVQVYSSDTANAEIFQFPLAVVIQGNKERIPAEGAEAFEFGLPELCENKNTQVNVNVHALDLSSVDAEISYECFGTKCTIGETENGQLTADFPQCVNGYVLARAEGYALGKTLFSTTQPGSTDVFLDKLYELNVDLTLDGMAYNGEAIIYFTSDTNSKTVVSPEQRTVELTQGQYEITAYIYRDSALVLSEISERKCVDVPRPGIGGLIGLTKEECFDIEIPSQDVESALAGGGKQDYFILEDELKNANEVEIAATSLPSPTTLEQLQNNYIIFESKGLQIVFN